MSNSDFPLTYAESFGTYCVIDTGILGGPKDLVSFEVIASFKPYISGGVSKSFGVNGYGFNQYRNSYSSQISGFGWIKSSKGEFYPFVAVGRPETVSGSSAWSDKLSQPELLGNAVVSSGNVYDTNEQIPLKFEYSNENNGTLAISEQNSDGSWNLVAYKSGCLSSCDKYEGKEVDKSGYKLAYKATPPGSFTIFGQYLKSVAEYSTSGHADSGPLRLYYAKISGYIPEHDNPVTKEFLPVVHNDVVCLRCEESEIGSDVTNVSYVYPSSGYAYIPNATPLTASPEYPPDDYSNDEPSTDYSNDEPSTDYSDDEPSTDYSNDEPSTDYSDDEPSTDYSDDVFIPPSYQPPTQPPEEEPVEISVDTLALVKSVTIIDDSEQDGEEEYDVIELPLPQKRDQKFLGVQKLAIKCPIHLEGNFISEVFPYVKRIVFENEVELDTDAIGNCRYLHEVVFSKIPYKISTKTFHDCPRLSSVVFNATDYEETPLFLPPESFSGCPSLKKLTFPCEAIIGEKGLALVGSVNENEVDSTPQISTSGDANGTAIPNAVLHECNAISEIVFEGPVVFYSPLIDQQSGNSCADVSVEFFDDVAFEGPCIFKNRRQLVNMTFSDGKKVTFGKPSARAMLRYSSIDSVEKWVVYKTPGAEQCFYNTGLTSVKIPGITPFSGVDTSTEDIFDDSYYAWSYEFLLGSAKATCTFTGTAPAIPNDVFAHCEKLVEVELPVMVKANWFYGCSSLTRLTLDKGFIGEVLPSDGSDGWPNNKVALTLGTTEYFERKSLGVMFKPNTFRLASLYARSADISLMPLFKTVDRSATFRCRKPAWTVAASQDDLAGDSSTKDNTPDEYKGRGNTAITSLTLSGFVSLTELGYLFPSLETLTLKSTSDCHVFYTRWLNIKGKQFKDNTRLKYLGRRSPVSEKQLKKVIFSGEDGVFTFGAIFNGEDKSQEWHVHTDLFPKALDNPTSFSSNSDWLKYYTYPALATHFFESTIRIADGDAVGWFTFKNGQQVKKIEDAHVTYVEDARDAKLTVILDNNSDGQPLFKNNKYVVKAEVGRKIDIPDNTFENCVELEDINFQHYTGYSIGKQAFSGCIKLTSIKAWPSRIREKAFYGCTGVAEIMLGLIGLRFDQLTREESAKGNAPGNALKQFRRMEWDASSPALSADHSLEPVNIDDTRFLNKVQGFRTKLDNPVFSPDSTNDVITIATDALEGVSTEVKVQHHYVSKIKCVYGSDSSINTEFLTRFSSILSIVKIGDDQALPTINGSHELSLEEAQTLPGLTIPASDTVTFSSGFLTEDPGHDVYLMVESGTQTPRKSSRCDIQAKAKSYYGEKVIVQAIDTIPNKDGYFQTWNKVSSSNPVYINGGAFKNIASLVFVQFSGLDAVHVETDAFNNCKDISLIERKGGAYSVISVRAATGAFVNCEKVKISSGELIPLQDDNGVFRGCDNVSILADLAESAEGNQSPIWVDCTNVEIKGDMVLRGSLFKTSSQDVVTKVVIPFEACEYHKVVLGPGILLPDGSTDIDENEFKTTVGIPVDRDIPKLDLQLPTIPCRLVLRKNAGYGGVIRQKLHIKSGSLDSEALKYTEINELILENLDIGDNAITDCTIEKLTLGPGIKHTGIAVSGCHVRTLEISSPVLLNNEFFSNVRCERVILSGHIDGIYPNTNTMSFKGILPVESSNDTPVLLVDLAFYQRDNWLNSTITDFPENTVVKLNPENLDCPSVRLSNLPLSTKIEITPSFDAYQWYLAGTGVNTRTIMPTAVDAECMGLAESKAGCYDKVVYPISGQIQHELWPRCPLPESSCFEYGGSSNLVLCPNHGSVFKKIILPQIPRYITTHLLKPKKGLSSKRVVVIDGSENSKIDQKFEVEVNDTLFLGVYNANIGRHYSIKPYFADTQPEVLKNRFEVSFIYVEVEGNPAMVTEKLKLVEDGLFGTAFNFLDLKPENSSDKYKFCSAIQPDEIEYDEPPLEVGLAWDGKGIGALEESSFHNPRHFEYYELDPDTGDKVYPYHSQDPNDFDYNLNLKTTVNWEYYSTSHRVVIFVKTGTPIGTIKEIYRKYHYKFHLFRKMREVPLPYEQNPFLARNLGAYVQASADGIVWEKSTCITDGNGIVKPHDRPYELELHQLGRGAKDPILLTRNSMQVRVVPVDSIDSALQLAAEHDFIPW